MITIQNIILELNKSDENLLRIPTDPSPSFPKLPPKVPGKNKRIVPVPKPTKKPKKDRKN